MGVAFSLVNKTIDLAQQTIGGLIKYVQDGMEANRKFDMSMARLAVSTKDFDVSLGSLKNTLGNFSILFGEDIDTLTKGVQDFIRRGYSASESIRMLSKAEQLAVVTGDDMATVTEAVNTALETFGYSAESTGYITKKLNEITFTTGQSISDINNIITRSAGAIQDAGIGIDDLANYLYTLDARGYDAKSMLIELKKILDDPTFKAQILPGGNIPTIETKFSEITNQADFMVKRWDELQTRLQEKRTLAFAGFDPRLQSTKDALEYADTGKINDPFMLLYNVPGLGMFVKQHISDVKELGDVIKEYRESLKTSEVDDFVGEMQVLDKDISTLKNNISTLPVEIAKINQELGDTTATRDYTISMHDASMAVQEQEDSIKALQRVADRYSLQGTINNLEIQKIQYGAMGSRRGLSRGQQKQIADIEKENALLRIEETEQGISIETIRQNSLQTTSDRLEQIKRESDAMMYGREIRDLDSQIATINGMWTDKNTLLINTNVDLETAMREHRSRELTAQTTWANSMYQQYLRAYYGVSGGPAGATGGYVPIGVKEKDVVSVVNQSIERGIMQRRGTSKMR